MTSITWVSAGHDHFVGAIAIGFANISSLFENLIQFVNIVGSLFYGTILGIFLAGFYFKRIQAKHPRPPLS